MYTVMYCYVYHCFSLPRATSAELQIQNLPKGERNWLVLLWFMVSPNRLTHF